MLRRRSCSHLQPRRPAPHSPAAPGAARTPRRAPAPGRAPRRAFTLLETSLALVVIGVGVLAFVEAQQAFLRSNSWSSQAATGALLANEIRERLRNLPRHDPQDDLFLSGTGSGATAVGWGPNTGETDPRFFDDIDDFDGLRFGADGDFPGPINASGDLIVARDVNTGDVMTDEDDVPLSLAGWSQTITITKVDPTNYAQTRAPAYSVPAGGAAKPRPVNAFPLRVTVVVEFQGPFDNAPSEVARVTWVVPESQ